METTQAPKLPITITALALVATSGLVAQFLAAEGAFDLVQRGPAYSFAAALLIEASVVVDALVLARSRNPLALVGLIIALIVSGIYNYILAASSTDLGLVPLLALAIGPLAALASIGLALGEEIYAYEERLAAWHEEQRQTQAQTSAQQRRRKREEHEARRRLELRHYELQLKDERAAQRRARAATDRTLTEHSDSDRTPTGHSDNGRTLDRTWPDKAAFLSDNDRPDNLNAQQLAAMTGISTRSARRWLADARKIERGKS